MALWSETPPQISTGPGKRFEYSIKYSKTLILTIAVDDAGTISNMHIKIPRSYLYWFSKHYSLFCLFKYPVRHMLLPLYGYFFLNNHEMRHKGIYERWLQQEKACFSYINFKGIRPFSLSWPLQPLWPDVIDPHCLYVLRISCHLSAYHETVHDWPLTAL